MITAKAFNPDFLDIFRCLCEARADFVVVGAHALALHGVPRATGDVDILVRPETSNALRVMAALRAFGAPVDAHGLVLDDLVKPGSAYQVGIPPRRIDLLTSVDGLTFEEAWESRVVLDVDGCPVGFLGLEALVRNKRAAARPKDLADLDALGR